MIIQLEGPTRRVRVEITTDLLTHSVLSDQPEIQAELIEAVRLILTKLERKLD